MSKIAIAVLKGLIEAVPKLIKLIQAGREPGDIRLEEIISTDALASIHEANDEARDFIRGG